MTNGIAGQSALVTGASRGIGAATAVALARAGARRVVIQYNSFPEGAEQTAAAVREAGAACDLLRADLSGAAQIRAFCDAARDAAADAGILVNNAGSLVKRAALADMDEETYERVMNLNVKSMYFLTQALVPGMIARGGGVIVNVSSIAARNGGGIGATVYAAAKAAVACITKGWARELAPKGIRVNAISPGTVDNHFHEMFSTREMLDAMLKATPAGRLGDNEETADLILFLCSDAARYIHGQTIEINGGSYMV